MRALLVAVLAGGCFSPEIGEGALVCGAGNLCPEGFHCGGGHCYQNPPPIDAPVDASGPCAAGGFLRCDGDELVQCAGDGGEGTTHCDFGCNSLAGQCNLCMPSASSCDAQGRLVVCASDGLSQSRTMCPADSNDCTEDLCVGGGCTHRNLTDGTPCATGVCSMGACVCGDMGQPCCATNMCTGGMVCTAGRCGTCGSMSQACCPNQTCGPGYVCSANMCLPCGHDTEPCCTGQSCESGNNCSGSTCHACGGLGESCCISGAQCSGSLGCVGGTCRCIPDCTGKACGADDGCGTACQMGTCTQGGTHCVGGQCVCDMVSCGSGCCRNGACQSGNTDNACGTNGIQCQQCMGLAHCLFQICQL